MYEAILPPRVDDRPLFTTHSLSGTIMMFQRLPALSVIVLVIAARHRDRERRHLLA